MQRILIVAAHPDDEVLGCFGSVARLIKEGAEAYTLILGEGKTSRDIINKEELEVLNQEFEMANKSIGIKEVFREYFPDNRFDSVDLLEIVKTIEKIKNKVKPNVIFTHFEKDLNIDHKVTFQAVLTATRPLPSEYVKRIYSFEILSSTEWNFGASFCGNVFFDISGTIEDKIKAMSYYRSELCQYPHPRSLEGIRLNAKLQGMRVGIEYAESFVLVRDVHKSVELIDFVDFNDAQKQLVFLWRNDESVAKYMHTKNITQDEHLRFFENLKESTNKKYFLLLKDEEPLGVIYFTNITADSCEFGLYSKPKLKGIGRILLHHIKLYAFNVLGVSKLCACALNCNAKAIALYTKFGFNLTNKDETMSYFTLSAGGGTNNYLVICLWNLTSKQYTIKKTKSPFVLQFLKSQIPSFSLSHRSALCKVG